jgi:hypothetical protein
VFPAVDAISFICNRRGDSQVDVAASNPFHVVNHLTTVCRFPDPIRLHKFDSLKVVPSLTSCN